MVVKVNTTFNIAGKKDRWMLRKNFYLMWISWLKVIHKLREMKTDEHVLLLKTNMEYGYGGASRRFDYLKDVALNYAFLFALEGITINKYPTL